MTMHNQLSFSLSGLFSLLLVACGGDGAGAGGPAGSATGGSGSSEDGSTCTGEACTGGTGGSGDGTSTGGAAATGGGGGTDQVDAPIGPDAYDNDCSVTGDFRTWHKVSVSCVGPDVDESDSTFTDYRMVVTFENGGTTLKVPGHFAADGDAANSSAASGNQWRAHLMPPSTGKWSYTVSFRSGSEVAVSDDSDAGSPVASIDGASGAFDVAATNKSGRDMRAHGLLEHNDGERYLRHRETGRAYVEGGADSPENLFGYDEFDDTTKHDSAGSCKGILHSFDPHEGDWSDGDPTWEGGEDGAEKGKSLIGVINYLASTGINGIYLVPMSEDGDGCDGHPWRDYGGNHRAFDVSRLEQWEVAFGHMTKMGLLIHFVTQETENDQLLNDGDLGFGRRLYYREMISRFGHHPALQWNLGEENTNTAAQEKAFASYFKDQDPYDHAVVMHTYPDAHDKYDDLLGFADFDGPTLQYSGIPESGDGGLYGETRDWLQKSGDAGHLWVVTATEASGGDAPTPDTNVTSTQRIYWMYANTMAGGGGFEWYLKNDGAGHAYDLAVEDLREFDEHWQQSGHLVRLFNEILPQDGVDLMDLDEHNGLTSTTDDWVLANPGESYLIFLRDGDATDLDAEGGGELQVTWFNPRTGEETDGGTISGASGQSLGDPPSETSEDWVVLVRK